MSALSFCEALKQIRALVGTGVGGAETWRNKFIHIYRRTDIDPLTGEIRLGTGTINDPYDGSTPARIEAILGPLSDDKTKANITWGPGIFPWRPMDPAFPEEHPWFVRDGWHWVGAGKGRTIFLTTGARVATAPNIVGRNLMAGWSRLEGDTEFVGCASFRGITFDGGVTEVPSQPDGWYAPGHEDSEGNVDYVPFVQYTVGLSLEGDDLTVEDCEFINMGGNGQEVFPVGLTNGLLGDEDRTCSIIFRRNRVNNIFSGVNSAGLTFGGLAPNLGKTNSVKQWMLIEGNHITDCYPALYNVRNVLIRNNWIDAGRAGFACINCDTGNNADVHIVDNVLTGAAYPYAVMGCICLGNPTEGVFDRFVIERNILAPGTSGYLKTGIRLRARVRGLIVKDNVYKRSGDGESYMILRDDDMPDPWGIAPDYVGLGDSFVPPSGVGTDGESNLNADPFYMSGNIDADTRMPPAGAENTVTGTLTVSSTVTTSGAFVAQGLNAGYNRLYVGSRAGIPGVSGAELLDPYSAASFGVDDVTRTAIEVVNRSSGDVGITLARTGTNPRRWSTDVAAITGNFIIANIIANPDAEDEGEPDTLTLSRLLIEPDGGVFTSFRSDDAWPLAADIPTGTAVDWKNTTANAMRRYSNDGGTLRYIDFT